MNGDISTAKSVKAFLSVESGKFFDVPEVTYKKISAYRIFPRNQSDGFISIDGESIPFEPFQAEVHRGLGRVLSKNGRLFEAPGPIGWDKNVAPEPVKDQKTPGTNGDTSNGANHATNESPPKVHQT